MIKISSLILPLLLISSAVSSYAASVEIVPGASGVYYLRAFDLVNVGGFEVEVQYNPSILANPRISQGEKLASTMFIPNTKFTASSVKIAAMSLSGVNGSGDLATISFDLKGGKAGPNDVVITRQKLATATGKTIAPAKTPVVASSSTGSPAAPASSGNAAITTAPNTATDTATVSGGAIASPAGINVAGMAPGSIDLPADQMASNERKADYQPLVTDLRKDMTLPLSGAEASASSAAARPAGQEKESEKNYLTYDGTLQLFKNFKGERSMKSLIALFADTVIPGFRQTPLISVADGITPLKITLTLKPSGDETPRFILQGASVIQLSSEGEGVTWTLEAVPKKDVFAARLTVIDGKRMYDYPLTVAPKIDPLLSKGKALSEADFALFLAKPSKYDLNKDEKYDAIDDYIYTANYIVAMNIKPEKSVKPDAPDKNSNVKPVGPTGTEKKEKERSDKIDKKRATPTKEEKPGGGEPVKGTEMAPPGQSKK